MTSRPQSGAVGQTLSTTPIYEASESGVPKGAVVVVQEAFGVNDHIKDIAQRFAAEGYRAVAPHLFHRSGDPVIPYDDFESAMKHVRQLTEDGIAEDLNTAYDHLGEHGFDERRTAIVGFCMGGAVAFVEAARRPLGAAVSFYGGGIVEGRFGAPALKDLASALKTPWLGCYGDQDKSIPPEQVELLREAVGHAAVDTEIVRYPDAGHGFHCDARAAYHEPSARDAWSRTLAWLDDHVG
jgi:carboxymethylenebutenolidase